MKQNLKTGRLRTLAMVAGLAFIAWLTACGRLPRTQTSGTAPFVSANSTTKPAPLNLNTASASELERLPGVGPVLAERIITYRNENGRFRRAEHLMMVRGISDRKFRDLQSLVQVE